MQTKNASRNKKKAAKPQAEIAAQRSSYAPELTPKFMTLNFTAVILAASGEEAISSTQTH